MHYLRDSPDALDELLKVHDVEVIRDPTHVEFQKLCTDLAVGNGVEEAQPGTSDPTHSVASRENASEAEIKPIDRDWDARREAQKASEHRWAVREVDIRQVERGDSERRWEAREAEIPRDEQRASLRVGARFKSVLLRLSKR